MPVGTVAAGKTINTLPAKAVLTPVGAPLTESVTAPEKPAASITPIVSVPPVFCCSVKGFAVGFRLNGDGAATTINVCCTGVAAAYTVLPAAEAMIVQLPVPPKFAVLPATEHTFDGPAV